MNKWMMRIGAVVLVAVMAFGIVSAASAQGPGGQGGNPPAAPDQLTGTVRQRVIQALEDALVNATGLTVEDIRQQLADGKTITQILQDKGVDPQTVLASVKDTLTKEINQAVTDGTITQKRADNMLSRLDDVLNRVMNQTFPTPRLERLHQRLEDSLIGVLAEMAGVNVQDLIKEAVTPPSLADLAKAHGLDPEAVITEAETQITNEINQAVTDGKITQAQADTLLAGLHDRLENRFNAPLGFLPGLRGGGMRGGGFLPGLPGGGQNGNPGQNGGDQNGSPNTGV